MNYSYSSMEGVGFSEGERRYAQDEYGVQFEYVLDPAAIDESPLIPNDIPSDSNTRFFLEYSPWWHLTWGLGTPWLQVDWDRSGTEDPDQQTKADVLGTSYPDKNRTIFDGLPLVFGPQLVEYGDDLLVFYVREGEEYIEYKTWREEGCDPEHLSPTSQCGGWVGDGVVDVDVDVKTDMSGVSIEVGHFCFSRSQTLTFMLAVKAFVPQGLAVTSDPRCWQSGDLSAHEKYPSSMGVCS